MSTETAGRVQLHRDGPVGHIVLDRPAKRNALSTHLLGELSRCLDDVAADSRIRVVTLEGAGPVFCAGADTVEFGSTTAELIRGAWTRLGQQVFGDLATLPQTTVALLSGSAFGGGLELAMHCDFRVAGENIEVGLPEASLGTAPGWAGVQRITEVAGLTTARLLVLTARRHTAEEALRMRLVDIVAADPELATKRLVSDILATTPVAQSILKRALISTAPTTSSALIDSLAGAYLAAHGETTPRKTTP